MAEVVAIGGDTVRQAVIVLGVTCALTACAGPSEPAQRGSPSPSPATATAGSTPDRADTVTCESRVDGYAVDHPQGWTAHDASDVEPCRWFSPEPLAADAGQDPAGIPVRLVLVPQALDEVERLESADTELLTTERREVGGQPAVRRELRSTGERLLPEGTRSTQWLVELGSRTLIAATSEAAVAGEYEQNVQVLDAMVRSLRLVEQEPVRCSAQGLPAEPDVQADLPAAVQETRRQVYTAAVRCDFERLGELVPQEGFTYSFGGGDDPTGAWRRAELQGEERAPMRYLAGLLQRPYGTREVQGVTHYSWPSAFSYDAWSDVPQRDREALQPLYGEQDFEQFEQFGGYVGYRVIIDAEGTWRVFVAGD